MLKNNNTAGKKSLISIFIQFGLFASLFFYIPSVHAVGELLVAPTRVVFEKRDRSARVSLINTGTETTTYRIKLEHKRMTEDGKFILVDEPLPGELFVDNLVRYSPRQVTLPPGQSQAIRIILRKPKDLPEGEYRSHMLFRSIPPTNSTNIENTADPDNQKLTIQLIPILGISIPVIVRHGNLAVDVSISDIQYQDVEEDDGEQQFVSLSLNRDGNQSIYGDLTATFIDEKGEKFVVGKANGLSVYSPNSHRIVKLALHPTPGLQIENGKLLLSYHQTADNGGQLLAESNLTIP